MWRFLLLVAVVLTTPAAAGAAATTRSPTMGQACTDGSQCRPYYECCLRPPGAASATCQRRGSTGDHCDQRMFWPDGHVISGIVQYQWCPCVPGEFCPPDIFGQPLQAPYTSICSFGK